MTIQFIPNKGRNDVREAYPFPKVLFSLAFYKRLVRFPRPVHQLPQLRRPGSSPPFPPASVPPLPQHSGLSCFPLLPARSSSILGLSMDSTIDAINDAYQEFLAAATAVFEAKDLSGKQTTNATDAALAVFKQKWELFRVACDQAEDFVESAKQRIGSECLVDGASGSASAKQGQSRPGLTPISAVQLEQVSKAVRWLVIELQQGSGIASTASHSHSSAPFDARFSEDGSQ